MTDHWDHANNPQRGLKVLGTDGGRGVFHVDAG